MDASSGVFHPRPAARVLSLLPLLFLVTAGCSRGPEPIVSALPFDVIAALERPVGPPKGTQWSPHHFMNDPAETATPTSLNRGVGRSSIPGASDSAASHEAFSEYTGSVSYGMDLSLEAIEQLDRSAYGKGADHFLERIEDHLVGPLESAGLQRRDRLRNFVDEDVHAVFRLEGLDGALRIDCHSYLSLTSRLAVVYLDFHFEHDRGFLRPDATLDG